MDVRLLFSIDQETANPEPPIADHRSGWPKGFSREIVNTSVCSLGSSHECKPIIEFYEERRNAIEKSNSKRDDGMLVGSEGMVLYLLTKEGYKLYKLKPESVEKVHWAAGGIPYSVVLATTWNALESCEGPLTAAYVNELLAEEFTATKILVAVTRVQKAVAHVIGRFHWRKEVLTTYLGCGIKYTEETRGDVMRELANSFPKDKMREVYNALRELGITR